MIFTIALTAALAQDEVDTGLPPPPSIVSEDAQLGTTMLDVDMLVLEADATPTERLASAASDRQLLRNAFEGPGHRRNRPLGLQIDTPEGTYRIVLSEQISMYPGTRTLIGRGRRGLELAVVTEVGDTIVGTVSAGGEERTFSMEGSGPLLVEVVDTDARVDEDGPPPTSGLTSPASPMQSQRLQASSPGGPYATRSVVDVLFAYDPDQLVDESSVNEARAITGIALANEINGNSNIQHWYRLAGIRTFTYDPPDNHCDAADDLRTDTSNPIHALRDAVGADIVVVAHPMFVGPSIGGCAPGAYPPTASTSDRAFTVVTERALSGDTLAHEFGHLAGLGHWVEGGGSGGWNTSYGLGYRWPDPQIVDTQAELDDICETSFPTGSETHRTVMTNGADHTVLGRVLTSRKVKFFSNPNLQRTFNGGGFQNPNNGKNACDDVPGVAPLGRSWPGSNGLWANAAYAVRQHLPILADYRAEVASSTYPGSPASVITSPSSGAHLTPLSPPSTIRVFTWTAESPTDDYWLEVYVPNSTTVFSNARISGTLAFVNMGSHGGLFAARLWTNMGTRWTYRDHRYNTANQFTDCLDDDLVIGNGAHDDAVCGGACSESGGAITCDLRANNSLATQMWASSRSFEQSELYDHAFRGERNDGTPFCCLYHDPDEQLQSILIHGTHVHDDIRLYDYGAHLRNTGPSLEVEVRGYQSGDILIGSDHAGAGYSEFLRGDDGDDIVIGGEGDDMLSGGQGKDEIYGGSGYDVLWAGHDADFDLLDGSGGKSTACTTEGSDLVKGFVVYVSENSTSAIHPQTGGVYCGHPANGTGWGACESYELEEAPAACAALGAPN